VFRVGAARGGQEETPFFKRDRPVDRTTHRVDLTLGVVSAAEGTP
jgi:hypothetical protein